MTSNLPPESGKCQPCDNDSRVVLYLLMTRYSLQSFRNSHFIIPIRVVLQLSKKISQVLTPLLHPERISLRYVRYPKPCSHLELVFSVIDVYALSMHFIAMLTAWFLTGTLDPVQKTLDNGQCR